MLHLTVEAIYENGILRPLQPLQSVTEHSKVKITIEAKGSEPHPLLQFAGILPTYGLSEKNRHRGGLRLNNRNYRVSP
ncbi:MAG: antitoxin family protein [Chloroflexi bacterium]|nr:antitoxin family protein [Chloroflexota bacterium]